MYNLFVSADPNAWDTGEWIIERTRCLTEYTDAELSHKYGGLGEGSLSSLKGIPAIFAYESRLELNPKFGLIKDLTRRRDKIRVDFELVPVPKFPTAHELEQFAFELDIRKWELSRTHWALKAVDLPKELARRGFQLPQWSNTATMQIDLSVHEFDVALSFPGEARALAEQVAMELERRLGPNRYFYDDNYTAQLARPNLDTFLQGIYRERSRLIVAFLSADYERKPWCRLEFRAIREIIMAREDSRVMFVRTDDGDVQGIFKTDGYVDARRFSAMEIGRFIEQRLPFCQ